MTSDVSNRSKGRRAPPAGRAGTGRARSQDADGFRIRCQAILTEIFVLQAYGNFPERPEVIARHIRAINRKLGKLLASPDARSASADDFNMLRAEIIRTSEIVSRLLEEPDALAGRDAASFRKNFSRLVTFVFHDAEKPETSANKLEERSRPSHEQAIDSVASQVLQQLKALPQSDRSRVLNRVAVALGVAFQKSTIVAPELWEDRAANAGENSISFLRRVYADMLPQIGLADISSIDRPLYLALKTWQKRHAPPSDLVDFFNSKNRRNSEEIDDELKKYGIQNPMDAYRKFPDNPKLALRLYSAAAARQRRNVLKNV